MLCFMTCIHQLLQDDVGDFGNLWLEGFCGIVR